MSQFMHKKITEIERELHYQAEIEEMPNLPGGKIYFVEEDITMLSLGYHIDEMHYRLKDTPPPPPEGQEEERDPNVYPKRKMKKLGKWTFSTPLSGHLPTDLTPTERAIGPGLTIYLRQLKQLIFLFFFFSVITFP